MNTNTFIERITYISTLIFSKLSNSILTNVFHTFRHNESAFCSCIYRYVLEIDTEIFFKYAFMLICSLKLFMLQITNDTDDFVKGLDVQRRWFKNLNCHDGFCLSMLSDIMQASWFNLSKAWLSWEPITRMREVHSIWNEAFFLNLLFCKSIGTGFSRRWLWIYFTSIIQRCRVTFLSLN